MFKPFSANFACASPTSTKISIKPPQNALVLCSCCHSSLHPVLTKHPPCMLLKQFHPLLNKCFRLFKIFATFSMHTKKGDLKTFYVYYSASIMNKVLPPPKALTVTTSIKFPPSATAEIRSSLVL